MSDRLTEVDPGKAAREGNQLRTAIFDSVTHELRTPLTSIKASVIALLTNSRLRPSQRNDLLIVIDEEADRLDCGVELGSSLEEEMIPIPPSINPRRSGGGRCGRTRESCPQHSSSRCWLLPGQYPKSSSRRGKRVCQGRRIRSHSERMRPKISYF